MLFEERIELMRKAKIAAMIFGGVSTCICGGILGVYSGTSTVGTVAPKNDVKNIYDVQSEKLANVAAVTSIKTTAVTTTSKVPTTLSVVSDFSADEPIAEIYSVITTAAPVNATTETTVSNEIYADYAESVEDDETDNNDDVVYTASFGNLTISGPFIATEEPETTTAVEAEVPAETTTEVEEEFVFEPSTEYYPPAVEYIAPVPETTETTTAETTTTTETTTATTSETTTTTAETTTVETTTEYVITTAEYTVPTTTAEETTTTYETTTSEITTYEITTEETTTTSEITTETTTAEVTTTEASTTTETITTTETTTTAAETTTSETTTETETTTDMMTATVDTTVTSLPITDEEYVLLCNAVANEAGSNWIDVYEKGKVVEVIMNRVNSPLYPNTIYEVITQPYQFTGSENYAYLTTYSGYVTDMVKEAVDLYFSEPSSFTHNYFGFYGDGYQNYFY